jgi:type I restriction enzyme R subunit
MLSVDGHDLCRVHVEPSGHPVHAEVTKVDQSGSHSKQTAFFIRLANGTKEISNEREIQRYIAQHWGPTG